MNFTWQGQSCGSKSRLLVHRGVYDEFVGRLSASVDRLPGNRPTSGPRPGRWSAARSTTRSSGSCASRDEGLRQVAGRGADFPDPPKEGLYIRPTVFADVDPASELAQQEIFGPVLASFVPTSPTATGEKSDGTTTWPISAGS